MRAALAGPNRPLWLDANDAELVKLIPSTQTLRPVHTTPKKPTYYNPVPGEKWKCQWHQKPDYGRIASGLHKLDWGWIPSGLGFWGQVDCARKPDYNWIVADSIWITALQGEFIAD
jgi:hypothetical protein